MCLPTSRLVMTLALCCIFLSRYNAWKVLVAFAQYFAVDTNKLLSVIFCLQQHMFNTGINHNFLFFCSTVSLHIEQFPLLCEQPSCSNDPIEPRSDKFYAHLPGTVRLQQRPQACPAWHDQCRPRSPSTAEPQHKPGLSGPSASCVYGFGQDSFWFCRGMQTLHD